MIVNYVKELSLLVEHSLEWGLNVQEQAVWLGLMHIINRQSTGNVWPDGFVQIDNRRLLVYVQLSEDAMMRARNQLVQHGLIEYVQGRKGKAAPMYRLILPSKLLCLDDGPQDHPRNDPQNSPQKTAKSAVDPADIYPNININTTVTLETDEDDDEDEESSRAREERRALGTAFVRLFGRSATPEELRQLSVKGRMLGYGVDMITCAMQRAAHQGARSPASYTETVMYNWFLAHVYTPEDADREMFHEDVSRGLLLGTGDVMEDMRLRRQDEEERIRRHEEEQRNEHDTGWGMAGGRIRTAAKVDGGRGRTLCADAGAGQGD